MSRLATMRPRVNALRGCALLATIGLLASFIGVLYTFVDVTGDVEVFVAVIAGTLVIATMLAHALRAIYAVILALCVLAVGMAWYILSLPYTPAIGKMIESNIVLLTGESIHQIRQSGTWAVAVAPAPIFATWYFALRRWYGTAVFAGGTMLGYVVLTGDATVPVALIGVVAAAAMLAFGDLDRCGSAATGAEYVAIGLAVMVAVPLAISVVPTGIANPGSLDGPGSGTGGGQTLETTLLDDDERFRIQGSIRLSPEVRFTIESEVGRLWKARSYDRYTGDGWAQTGGATPLNQTDLAFPAGARQIVTQRISTESRLATLPAAWRPISVGNTIADNVSVTAEGDITSAQTLEDGDAYWVSSAVRTASDAVLRTADDTYPEQVSDRYTSLPASTPDRVGERTAEITDGANSPYTKAQAIESWLEENREYSLDVDRPEGNIAESFLFDMEQGYCTYYATTMVVMLRSEGIPARLATGYSTGQQVDDTSYVVRGLNAHAWVEMYFPGSGWVSFDPTPAEPRTAVRQSRIEEARTMGEADVDTNESQAVTETPTPTRTETISTPTSVEQTEEQTPTPVNGSEEGPPGPAPPSGDGGLSGSLPDLPPREHLALGLVLLGGAAAGIRRSGLAHRLARSGRIRFQRRHNPKTDVEIAFRRAAIILERKHRPRETGETVRQYLDAIDAPQAAHRIAAIQEQALYAGHVEKETADEAIESVDRLRAVYGSGRIFSE